MAGQDSAEADPDDLVAEAAVRAYLRFLSDPSQLLDEDEVDRLRAVADAASDPIDRLRALSRLEQASTVDGGALVGGFIRHAKSWTERHAVSINAYRQLGVDDSVLRAAGLLGGARRKGTPGAVVASSVRRPASVTAVEIQRTVAGWHGEFLVGDVAARVGGSPMTIRKALDHLIAVGKVRRVGPAVGHVGPGRAPMIFECVSPSRE